MIPRLFKAVFLGFLIGTVGLLISPFRFALNIEENAGLGLLFKLRGARPAPADVVVVSIDKESSEHLNLPNNPDKWPRSLHEHLTDNLFREGARSLPLTYISLNPIPQRMTIYLQRQSERLAMLYFLNPS